MTGRMMRGPRGIRWCRTPREVGEELEAELEVHLEARIADLEGRGYLPAEARAEALRRFGDIEEMRRV